jgi:hypothetical protein
VHDAGGGGGSDAGIPAHDAGGGSDAGVPAHDAGGAGSDAGIAIADAGANRCAPGCGQRTGYHLFCPSTGLPAGPSWCAESPSCGAMDTCQASQLASCNAMCPGGCAAIFDGPVSCCDCAVVRGPALPSEVTP